ncbi:23S rRNA pseudouridine2605 synthase [Bradyrhizobium sp. AZCC 1578]|uniref:pseudouridine synthase n=1 Tax=Bradyrhizobium sp. AZCC 1578 TaxID=3117027 RepID=UPI002FEE66BC
MPRDNDKNNDSRGRRDRPGGGQGRAGGGKGRSGAARGPEKKFAKRGFGARDGDERGGERRPYAGKSEGAKSFGKKPYAGKREGASFRRDDDRPPRRDFGDRPRARFDREDRSGGDRPERGPRKDFRARDDRDGDKRSFKPRGDRGSHARDERPARREREEGRPAGRSSDRKFGDKRPYTPRGEGFRKDGDRPRGDRPYGDRAPRDGEKRISRSPRKDFGDRPERGEDKPWQRRDDRGGGERPRFSRSREDRPKFDRPCERGDRDRDRERPAGRTEWQEHPRSEGRFRDRPRRDNEDDGKIFAKRPAFGGRGAYRERPTDFDKCAPRAEPKPKKAGERIAKVVARAGLASRRDAEEWITQGRVTVNGRVINSPALDVTANDVIAVDGKVLPPRERTRLFMYHKPRGLMTTHADPEGRPTVFDNLPEGLPRLISVGRLDFNTEGLLLLTNDGGLARALELPDTGWLRRYRVRAHGEVTQAQLDDLKKGVEVDGVKYGSIDATLERDQGANVWLVFAIREGKNREVRNVMAHLGLEVNRLIRVSYGPFQLGELAEGQVEEVKTRVLREQLGEKIAALAGADFNRPMPGEKSDSEDDAARGKKPFKPAGKSALIADRKGRRVLVQRTGSEEARARNEDEANGYGPPRRPRRGYHGKRDLKPRDE